MFCKTPRGFRLNSYLLIQWWFVYPDTFVPCRYFRINEFSGLLNRPLVRTWKSVPTLFVRTNEISGLSEPGLTNHLCILQVHQVTEKRTWDIVLLHTIFVILFIPLLKARDIKTRNSFHEYNMKQKTNHILYELFILLQMAAKIFAAENGYPCVDTTFLDKYMNQEEVRTSLHIPQALGKWTTCSSSITYQRFTNNNMTKQFIAVLKNLVMYEESWCNHNLIPWCVVFVKFCSIVHTI